MKDQDFGACGKETDGYVYKQDQDRSNGSGRKRDDRMPPGGPLDEEGTGCLGCIMMLVGIPALLLTLGALAGIGWVLSHLF